MEKLKKIGKLTPKKSCEIKHSKISLGFEKLDFLNTAFKTGMGKYPDYISFHEYTHDERNVYEIPEEILEDKGDGVYVIKELPIKDAPLILTFDDFIA